MKKNTLIKTIFLLIPILASCETRIGVSITFSANLISKEPSKTVKTFEYKDYSFSYYNVYNDGNGNFVMADNTSYILNLNITFGIRVKTPYVYTYRANDETFTPKLIESKQYDDYKGYYNFSISDHGFKIYGAAIDDPTPMKDVNIGQIVHWC